MNAEAGDLIVDPSGAKVVAKWAKGLNFQGDVMYFALMLETTYEAQALYTSHALYTPHASDTLRHVFSIRHFTTVAGLRFWQVQGTYWERGLKTHGLFTFDPLATSKGTEAANLRGFLASPIAHRHLGGYERDTFQGYLRHLERIVEEEQNGQ